jgi:peptide/nickel transport system ATP-binding protein
MDLRFSAKAGPGRGMSERTERSEGHERMPIWLSMSERTERSEGHERMPIWLSMSERTERIEGHERMPKGGAA